MSPIQFNPRTQVRKEALSLRALALTTAVAPKHDNGVYWAIALVAAVFFAVVSL